MVTSIAGNQADIALALQSAQGVASATAQHRMFLTAGGLGPVKETADIEETTASRLRNTAYVRAIRAEGAPSCVVRPNFLGLLLYAAMGAKSVSGVGPYVHVFTLASVLPYLTAWRRLGPEAAGGLYEKFVDCKVGQLVIASSAGGLIIATPTILGLGPSFLAAAMTAVAPESTNAFLHADGVGTLKVDNVAIAAIESSEWSIGNGAAAQQGDSVSPYMISEGLQDIQVKTTQLVTDFALWNQYIYGSATPAGAAVPSRNVYELALGLDFKWTRPAAAGTLQLVAPRVQVVPDSIVPNVNGDPLKMSVTYKVYQPVSGSGLTATLTNGQVSYPAV